jgi:DNA polymerase-3 subunit delta
MRLFLDRCGTDMGNIDRELEKLICYTMGREVIEASDVETITTEHVEDKIFVMIGAISEHNKGMALSLYYDLVALRVAPRKIFTLIMRQFLVLLNTKDMAAHRIDNATIAQVTGAPTFAVPKNIKQARNFSLDELKNAIAEGCELEEAVKTGNLTDTMAVEMFITKYSTKKPA